MLPLYALLVITVVLSVERTITLIILWEETRSGGESSGRNTIKHSRPHRHDRPGPRFPWNRIRMISAFKSVSEASSVQLQVVAAGCMKPSSPLPSA